MKDIKSLRLKYSKSLQEDRATIQNFIRGILVDKDEQSLEIFKDWIEERITRKDVLQRRMFLFDEVNNSLSFIDWMIDCLREDITRSEGLNRPTLNAWVSDYTDEVQRMIRE